MANDKNPIAICCKLNRVIHIFATSIASIFFISFCWTFNFYVLGKNLFKYAELLSDMLYEILILIITLVLGPGVFWFFSHIIYANVKSKKFPVGFHDGVGDILFLPFFNATAVYLGVFVQNVNIFFLTISVFVGFLVSLFFVIYRKNIAKIRDWSISKGQKFNAGGWYHLGFMFVQASFMMYSILIFPTSLLFWIVIGLFLALLFGHWCIKK